MCSPVTFAFIYHLFVLSLSRSLYYNLHYTGENVVCALDLTYRSAIIPNNLSSSLLLACHFSVRIIVCALWDSVGLRYP